MAAIICIAIIVPSAFGEDASSTTSAPTTACSTTACSTTACSTTAYSTTAGKDDACPCGCPKHPGCTCVCNGKTTVLSEPSCFCPPGAAAPNCPLAKIACHCPMCPAP